MNNKILKSLKRIELQNKANWYDLVFLFIVLMFWIIFIFGCVLRNLVWMIIPILVVPIFLLIQLAEKKDMNNVRRYYNEKTIYP